MYSLTKPLSTVVLLIDAIRFESFEEIADTDSSLGLGSDDRDDPDGKVMDFGLDLASEKRDLSDGKVMDSGPDLGSEKRDLSDGKVTDSGPDSGTQV